MKIVTVFVTVIFLLLSGSGLYAGNSEIGGEMTKRSAAVTIRILFGEQEALVDMFDTPASKDFMALLPLTLEFEDFAGAEKIAYLPRRLNTRGSPAVSGVSGDFAYYAPWGNLAVFYKGFGSGGQLYVLGRIVSGKGALAKMATNFTAKIEKTD